MSSEASRYIDHLLNINNPVVYAVILCGVIVLMCYIFYFHMYFPQKRKMLEERIKTDLNHSRVMVEKFRFLTLELQENIESEKQRLGRELHDSIGQNLLFMKMKVIEKFGSDGVGLVDVIDSTIRDLKEITHDLRPRTLQELGLPSAIFNLTEYINANSSISGKVSVYGSQRTLGNKKELYLYRVIQETLNNIIKHSGAREYNIDMDYSERALKLLVLDDGNGFDFNSTDLTKGSGLLNIEERIKSIGGSINFKSDKESGTIIKMEIPYD